MSDELKQSENPNDDLSNETNVDDLDIEDVVKLTPQQYAALLDKINELESSGSKVKTYNLDDLADEGRSRPQPQQARQPDKNLDDMSRLELAQYIVTVIGEHFTPVANDLQVQIQTIKVAQEIDRASSKYDDFWDLHNDILRIGSENPSLSIEKAYKLAKAERGEQPIKSKDKERTLLTLPPKPLLGERPNAPSRNKTHAKTMTLSEAAEKAWADAGIKE